MTRTARVAFILGVALAIAFAPAVAQTAQSALPPGGPQLVSPEELLKVLQTAKGEKPLILNVGPSILYMQAHIPGSEYIGQGSTSQGLATLRSRVKSVSHDTEVVLYCGCCPWEHCPNVAPAYAELTKMGFKRVKVLYIANNFGADWVDKGYPTVKGQ